VASTLLRARAEGRILDVPITDELEFGLDDAYAVQAELTAARLAAGQRIAGWKLGYTSLAMREQMGIDRPNFGPLTDVMRLSAPAALPAGSLHPRAEPEIGLVLARDLAPGGGTQDVLDACAGAYACLEVVDSVWAGYRFRIEDNTADGSSAGWFVVGDEVPLDDLPGIEVDLLVDGRSVDRATGAAAGGHPAAGVAWLAGQVHKRYARPLAAGAVILTGGLTAAVPLAGRASVRAEFRGRPRSDQSDQSDQSGQSEQSDQSDQSDQSARPAVAELTIPR
jgi:2-keto-4-pentenoate hydratase